MKKLLVAIIVLAALAASLLFAGTALESRPLIAAGALSLAVSAFAVGLREITGRYARDYGNPRDVAVFTGAGAILVGIETLALSGALAVGAIAYWMHLEDALLAFVLDRPGFALLAAGLAFVGGGGARVLGPRDWKGSFLLHLPERIGSVVLFLVGLAHPLRRRLRDRGAAGLRFHDRRVPRAAEAASRPVTRPAGLA